MKKTTKPRSPQNKVTGTSAKPKAKPAAKPKAKSASTRGVAPYRAETWLSTTFYHEIAETLKTARARAYRAIDSLMVEAYWNVGRRIVEEEQQGEERAGYGTSLLHHLSIRLTDEFGAGFTERNLRNFRQFYLCFPIRHTLCAESLNPDATGIPDDSPIRHALRAESPTPDSTGIPGDSPNRGAVRPELSWTHYRLLIRVENETARQWYLREAAEQNWSSRALARQIHSLYYERLLSSKDKNPVIEEMRLRNHNTVEFLGVWESVHNPRFNHGEIAIIKSQVGLNSYKLSVKEWAEKTSAIGLRATAGRYGGTYAHQDIAFEFGMWISPEFKIYLIKEFQRLKEDESRRLSLAWNLNRTLSKLNYRIHTDAIKAHLIPPEVTPAQAAITYATEADLLNVALFGSTARQWRDANPKLDGNMRDHASIEQLLVLTNLESLNAEPERSGDSQPKAAHRANGIRQFIHMQLPQTERLTKLNAIAICQMQTLAANAARLLEGGSAG